MHVKIFFYDFNLFYENNIIFCTLLIHIFTILQTIDGNKP